MESRTLREMREARNDQARSPGVDVLPLRFVHCIATEGNGLMAGRPTKRTPENRKIILDAIEQGVPYRHAAAMAGMDEDTLLKWRASDTELSESIKAAEGRAVMNRLLRIRLAEPDHWQAAAWWLERKYPQEFGKTVQEQQHTGKDGAPLTININRVTGRES